MKALRTPEDRFLSLPGYDLQEDKGEELADVLNGFISPGTGACP